MSTIFNWITVTNGSLVGEIFFGGIFFGEFSLNEDCRELFFTMVVEIIAGVSSLPTTDHKIKNILYSKTFKSKTKYIVFK